ncbi:antifungal protein [Aspergillus egyptiacus]|nr:antifungal protein [Aspergillus egyptiacus]
MKSNSFILLDTALFTALGGLASPVNPDLSVSSGLAMRSERAVLADYPGKCYKKTNQCHYTTQSNGLGICRCHFKMCTADRADCYYESVGRKCICD